MPQADKYLSKAQQEKSSKKKKLHTASPVKL